MDLSRPPVKAGGRVNRRRLLLQRGTARQLHLLQLLDTGEMVIDEDGIGQRPQMLGGLQFGGIRRQEQQMGAIRFSETAGWQGLGSTPQGVTTCCPTSGAIPDPW